MISVLRRAVDNFLGRGQAAVTVPVMDGPLKPNQLLEAAGRVLTAPDIDNLAATPEGMLYTSGNVLAGIPGGEVALSFGHFVPRGRCRRGDGDRLRGRRHRGSR